MTQIRRLTFVVCATLVIFVTITKTARSVVPSTVRLASWNIRFFSTGSRDDTELQQISQVLLNYDFIAIMELRDEEVLQRTQTILASLGRNYNYEISIPLGASNPERYAFLYDADIMQVLTPGQVYPDPNDDFIREPYYATFRAGQFDFTIIVVHVIFGQTVGQRQAEILLLDDVCNAVQAADLDEQDVLLVGDFNREPDDAVAYADLFAMPAMINVFNLPDKSHIKDSSLYDNIFFQTNYLSEYTGSNGINRFDETMFANDDAAANLAVSDHRPVWAEFSTISDDDPDVPLAVELFSFSGVMTPEGVSLQWRTESETNHVGFHISRSPTEAGEYRRITPALIPGMGTDSTPQDYTFFDETAHPGHSYWYIIEDLDFSGRIHKSHPIQVEVRLQTTPPTVIPTEFSLYQNFPNPFNPQTWIPFDLAEPTEVTVTIYDTKGSRVGKLDLGLRSAGTHQTTGQAAYWNGRDGHGQRVSSGMYFYQLQAGHFRATKKMVILQ